MTTDRDAVYNESTDEEGENIPDPSVLAPGKINAFISFMTISLGLTTLIIIIHNEKCYEKFFSTKNSLDF